MDRTCRLMVHMIRWGISGYLVSTFFDTVDGLMIMVGESFRDVHSTDAVQF